MSAAINEAPLVDLTHAVQIARRYLADAYREQRPGGILLEEVELAEDNSHWLITLGFDNPHLVLDPLQALAKPMAEVLQPRDPRIFKTFKIDCATGKVISMKMRSP